MKKSILLSVALFVAATISVNAQCTPDPQYTSPGYYPTTLPEVIAGEAYNSSITVIAPTTVSGYTIDSIKITSITGMPSGLTYTTNKARDVFPKGATGCILLSGTVAANAAGSYPLTLNITAYGLFLGNPVAVPYTDKTISMTVKPVGIETPSTSFKFDVFQNFPNPLNDKTTISFTSPDAKSYTYQVMNMVGATVYQNQIDAKRGLNEVSFQRNALMPGMYFYKISDGQNTITKRMIIKD